MNQLIVDNKDIEPYISRGISDDRKQKIWELTGLISEAVSHQIPLGVSYNNNPRLILPHSLYLQRQTSSGVSSIVKPNIRTRMKFYSRWARRAIGIDAFQLFSQSDDSRDGWKTLHLDRIDDNRLMTPEEICRVFGVSNEIDDHTHLIDGFATIWDFVGNWNYSFRDFLIQTKAHNTLAIPTK